MSAYFYFIKLKILSALTYRFEFFASIGTNLITMFASVFLWKTVYRGFDTVSGVTEAHMVTYAIVSILLGSIFSYNIENTINGRIREGQIATDFMRPLNLLLSWFSEDIGESVTFIIIRYIPLLIIASVIFQPSLPENLSSALLFIPSCMLSFGILWLLSALAGMMAFWYVELGNIGLVKESVMRILSGSIVPLWFFPKSIQKISAYLPFQYTYQTPLGIYIGKITMVQAMNSMLIQAFWVIILLFILHRVWKKAKRHVMVQGG